MVAVDTRITRDDLERKFRELQGEAETTAKEARSYAIAAGAVAMLVIAVFAFILGGRRGKKKSTIVEVRRL